YRLPVSQPGWAVRTATVWPARSGAGSTKRSSHASLPVAKAALGCSGGIGLNTQPCLARLPRQGGCAEYLGSFFLLRHVAPAFLAVGQLRVSGRKTVQGLPALCG